MQAGGDHTSTITPGHYPIGVQLFAAFVAFAVIWSIFALPPYLTIARQIRSAEREYHTGNFDEASAKYDSVLQVLPSSEVARIGAAEVLFANKNPDDDEAAMKLLDSINLDEKEWARIKAVLPEKYRNDFQEFK